MFRVAYSILHNQSECEDAASAAVLSAYQAFETLKDYSYFRAWVMKILKNECYAILRKRKNDVHFDETWELGCEDDVPNRDLQQAVQSLSYNYRVAITLYYVEGYSIKELSHMFDIPVGTMKSRLSRARTALKKTLIDLARPHRAVLQAGRPNAVRDHPGGHLRAGGGAGESRRPGPRGVERRRRGRQGLPWTQGGERAPTVGAHRDFQPVTRAAQKVGAEVQRGGEPASAHHHAVGQDRSTGRRPP